MTEISIVIPTLNDAETLDACLESLDSQNYPEEKYEVIIVDGGSDDGTLNIAHEYNCRVLFEEEGTISYARELGVQKADGSYIAFTDADCVVPDDWLVKLKSTVETDEHVAGVGGPNVTPEDDKTFAKAVGDFFELFSKVGARYGFTGDEITEVHHNPTCNVIYKREVLEEVGGFNEQLVTVDDEEMDYRIREQGYRLLFRPDAPVDHYRRPTWRRFQQMAYTYGYGRGQAVRIHSELGKWFHYGPTIIGIVVIGLFLAALLTPIPLFIPLSVVFIGEISILGIAAFMRLRTNRSLIRYYLLINVWHIFWGIGFAQGIVNPPSTDPDLQMKSDPQKTS
ncbi:glycosyltransferase [Halobellus sp. EA9]|uniref:glycosyltransferase n=1 Tax=Halobellus sp. EA9 TaxID=3421647 RepID=UPI003EBF6670